MKPETSQVIHEVITKTVENPKIGMAVGGTTGVLGSGATESFLSISANDFAVYIGIAVAAVSLYNQIMVAIRSHRDSKIKSID